MPVYKQRRQTLNWIAGGPDGEPGRLLRRLKHVYSERAAHLNGSALEKPFVLAVGISVAAPVDPADGRLVAARPADGLILKEEEGSIACADWDGESASKGLRDRLLGSDLYERFGWSQTSFHSDSASELCARAELRGGELSEADVAIFVKWTGNVSAAVVLHGHIVAGSRGLAGSLPLHSQSSGSGGGKEPGRLPLGIEVGIRRLHEEIGEELGLRKRRGDELLRDYFRDEILSIARGEKLGREERAHVISRLRDAAALVGENLAPAVDMLDPSKVVIGGGVFEKRDWPIIAEPLSDGIRREIAVSGKTPDVTLARYQDYPALRGAIASRLETDLLVDDLLRACENDSLAAAPEPLIGVGGLI
jgi:predicted NBD/HSP70 family sugar kinase